MELNLGYKQTEVGIIPEDWDVEPVGEAFNICNQFRLPISRTIREKMAGPYPYYGPTSVQGYIDEYRIEGECALIGEDGDHFLKWRDYPMTSLVRGKFNVNNHAHVIKGTSNSASWFYFYFLHRDLTSYLTRQGAGRYKLTKNVLVRIPCAIPPVCEQRAIAATLADVDILINALDKLIAKKRDIKQATVQQLLTGKKRLPGYDVTGACYKQTEIGLIPEDWRVKRLGDFLSLRRGHDLTEAQRRPGDIPIMGSAGRNGFHDIAIAKGPGVIVGRSGASFGQAHFCENDYWPHNTALYVTDFRGSDPLFSYYFLKSMDFSRHNSGGAQQSLNRNFINPILIGLPDLPEQRAIATVLSDMDAEIAAMERKRDKTRLLQQGMMQELLTGRTRLPIDTSPEGAAPL